MPYASASGSALLSRLPDADGRTLRGENDESGDLMGERHGRGRYVIGMEAGTRGCEGRRGVVLGAAIARRQVRKGFDAIRNHDLDTLVGMFAEDAVFEFPPGNRLGGRHEGHEALRAWFGRWFDRMPEIRFTLRHVSVEKTMAMGGTNVVHAEWDLDEKDADGNSYHLTGVTAFDIRGGKAHSAKDYIFEQDRLGAIWPRQGLSDV